MEFSLTPAELAQMNSAGRSRTFYNRVAWASTYLRAALLLDSTGRGRFRITERGKLVLAKDPKRIDIPYLMQFPEFKASRGGPGKQPGDTCAHPHGRRTDARGGVRVELPEHPGLHRAGPACPGEGREPGVLRAARGGPARGDGVRRIAEDAGKAIGQSGDGGIDGVIKEDRLGLDTIYLQAKRWEGNVGRPVVQAFVGSLAGQHARRGVLITTSDFSGEARKYVKGIEQRIILIDGAELARLMFEFGVGVTPVGSP